MSAPIRPAQPHGALQEVLPGLHLVQGCIYMGPLRLSRNMTVVQRGGDLVLINSVRLNEEGLAALDQLGTVTDVIRLAAAHGSDDPFYKERYGATIWDVKGQRYFEGVNAHKGRTYFTADHQLEGEEVPPLPDARLFAIETDPPEGLILLPTAGGTLVSGDVLHHWADAKEHFNWLGGTLFRILGFVGPYKLGKGWLDLLKPDPRRLEALLALPFENVLPAHGDPVIDDAQEKYRPAVEAYVRSKG